MRSTWLLTFINRGGYKDFLEAAILMCTEKNASLRLELLFTCNPAALEAEFRNGVGSIPVGVNSPSISGWIV